VDAPRVWEVLGSLGLNALAVGRIFYRVINSRTINYGANFHAILCAENRRCKKFLNDAVQYVKKINLFRGLLFWAK
jgi:hypothetical protein